MSYKFDELQQKIKGNLEWLQAEYFSIRTGRATPAVLDGVRVDSYGSLVALNQVATVSVEDARSLRILPYDVSQSKEIEKAITNTNLGLSVAADDKGVRVFFPELTSETRTTLIKAVKDKLEQARVALRSERDAVWSDIQKQEKEGELSEDEKYTLKEEMQKIIDEASSELEKIADAKETELAN